MDKQKIYVKILKEKIRALVYEISESLILPDDWEDTIFHTSLQIIRCDPSVATGFTPSELLLGRKLIYPFELKNSDVDLTGTNLTKPLIDTLKMIREKFFQKEIFQEC